MKKKITIVYIFLITVMLVFSATKTVYCTPSGKSYHSTRACKTLARSKSVIEISLENAQAKNLKPCKVCHYLQFE